MSATSFVNLDHFNSRLDDVYKHIADAKCAIDSLKETLDCYDHCVVIDYDAETVIDDEETVIDDEEIFIDDEETVIDDEETFIDDDAETVIVKESDSRFRPMESYVVVYQRLHDCKICEFKTKFKSCLENHILFRHSDSRQFRCDYDNCNKSFKTKNCLKQHKYTHSEKKLECDKCDKKFTYPSSLCSHKRKKHSNL